MGLIERLHMYSSSLRLEAETTHEREERLHMYSSSLITSNAG